MKAGASVIESAESGIELSASAQSGSGSTQTGQNRLQSGRSQWVKVDGPNGSLSPVLKVEDIESKQTVI